MTDEKERTVRDAARAKLDTAISEYHASLWAENPAVMMVGGWVLVAHGVNTDASVDNYLVERAAGQPWHASVGLVQYACSYFDSVGDEL